MKSLLLLWKEMAEESAIRCCTSAHRDYTTVAMRVKSEGESFLTITLPSFGKSFERSLDLGRIGTQPCDFPGFGRERNKGGFPRFLGGFLGRIFDRSSGQLLQEPCLDAILAVRQLTLMFGKINKECSPARIADAFQGYLSCEQEVRDTDNRLGPFDYESFRRVSSVLFAHLFTEVDCKIYHGDHVPMHGPGATADRLMGNQKFYQQTWPSRLEEYFPSGEFLIPSPSYFEELEKVDFLEPGSEIPVKVITVPKTLKTPRIIAMEPTAQMYAQKSLQLLLYDAVNSVRMDPAAKRNPLRRALSRMIGFEDQTPNQRLAQKGSIDGSLATLDLSEASDRVSNELVMTMLQNHTHLHGAVQACRSTRANVQGEIIELAKFASMGSALCFPMEAMVFLTCVFLGIEETLNRPLRPSDVIHYSDKVRVYGDDIIVPVETVHTVIRSLEYFGARVNSTKSFWTGKFRESCGKEFYDGFDVSIVRVREEFPVSRQDATGVISLVELRNQLYFAGYWRTLKWLDSFIVRMIKFFPIVESTSPVLGRHSFLGYQAEDYDSHLHSPLVKGWRVKAKSPINRLDDWPALLKFHLKRGDEPHDEGHLERSGRSQRVDIMLRRSSPF